MALDSDDGVVLADSSDVLVVRRHVGCHIYSLLTHVVGARRPTSSDCNSCAGHSSSHLLVNSCSVKRRTNRRLHVMPRRLCAC